MIVRSSVAPRGIAVNPCTANTSVPELDAPFLISASLILAFTSANVVLIVTDAAVSVPDAAVGELTLVFDAEFQVVILDVVSVGETPPVPM